eukprot:767341_1
MMAHTKVAVLMIMLTFPQPILGLDFVYRSCKHLVSGLLGTWSPFAAPEEKLQFNENKTSALVYGYVNQNYEDAYVPADITNIVKSFYYLTKEQKAQDDLEAQLSCGVRLFLLNGFHTAVLSCPPGDGLYLTERCRYHSLTSRSVLKFYSRIHVAEPNGMWSFTNMNAGMVSCQPDPPQPKIVKYANQMATIRYFAIPNNPNYLYKVDIIDYYGTKSVIMIIDFHRMHNRSAEISIEILQATIASVHVKIYAKSTICPLLSKGHVTTSTSEVFIP